MTQERKKPGRSARSSEAQSSNRPPRVPMSAGNKLSAPKRPGFQRYWAITGPDHPGKIEQMQAAYWDFVLDENGEKVQQAAGKGNTHVLMEIEQHYYDEDMTNQQKRSMDATQHNVQALGDSEYVPLGQDKVVTRDII